MTLERESGVINGDFSDDLLFLRQLILDGQWDDIFEFIQPLSSLPSFDVNRFRFVVLKAKFVELLCIRGENQNAMLTSTDAEGVVDTVVDVLKEIEKVSPTKEAYSNLCLLLTMNKLSDHPDFRSWNPSKGRIHCFREVLPLVENLLGVSPPAGSDKRKQHGVEDQGDQKKPPLVASNDRLLQLLIKGILYESCVDFCQQRATGQCAHRLILPFFVTCPSFTDRLLQVPSTRAT